MREEKSSKFQCCPHKCRILGSASAQNCRTETLSFRTQTAIAPPIKGGKILVAMDPTEKIRMEDSNGLAFKTVSGTMSGFVGGSVWGAVVASWYDVPKVERSVALPGLIRTVKLMGNYGFTFAAIGGVFALTDHVAEKFREKKDFWNGAIGGFVAGASVLGLRGRTISSAISAGAALAATAAIVDASGQTTRIDNGTVYFPYTVEKKP